MSPLRRRRLSHQQIRRLVSAYVDGELSPSSAAYIEAHLRQCWGCSGDAESIRLIKTSLGHLAGEEPDSLASVRLRRWAATLSSPT